MLSTTAFLAIAMQCAASIHPSTAFDVARWNPVLTLMPSLRSVPKAGPSSAINTLFLTCQPAGEMQSIFSVACQHRIAVTLSG